MDHHCIFTNSCIGETNHRNFILLSFYIFLACVYVFAMSKHWNANFAQLDPECLSIRRDVKDLLPFFV